MTMAMMTGKNEMSDKKDDKGSSSDKNTSLVTATSSCIKSTTTATSESPYFSSSCYYRPTATTTTTTMKIMTMTTTAAAKRTTDFTTWFPPAKDIHHSYSSPSSSSLLQQAQQQILACSASSASSSSSSSGRGSGKDTTNIDDYYISPQLIQERLIEQANQAAEAAAQAAEAARAAANASMVAATSSATGKDGNTSSSSSSSSDGTTKSNNTTETETKQELLGDGPYGPLCQYRRGFFEHLYPKALFRNTLKITLQQGIVTLANFLSEQLEGDLKRTKLIDEGHLSAREAEEQAEEWERVEWNKRWKAFPNKLLVALAKYHAVTLTLRLYESICSLFCDAQMMDKLTMDFFAASRTLAKNLLTQQQQDSNKNVSNSNMTMTSAVRSQPLSVVSEMTLTTFWANILITLADYSVHQVLLCYGYYKYYERQRKKFAESQKKLGLVRTEDDDKKLQKDVTDHLVKNSTQLFLSRGCGLVCSSIGGGFGTVVRPGWGTLMISSMAEGTAPSLVDDGSASATAELTSDSSNNNKPKSE